MKERNAEIAACWTDGQTAAEISAQYGITRQRVHQIVRKSGQWSRRPKAPTSLITLLERGLPIDRPPDACWEWTRGRHGFGYGFIRSGTYAHRVSYEVFNGPIPKGMCVLHRCDNPPCCNPAHLWLGTQIENIRDRDAKGRGRHGPNAPHLQKR